MKYGQIRNLALGEICWPERVYSMKEVRIEELRPEQPNVLFSSSSCNEQKIS